MSFLKKKKENKGLVGLAASDQGIAMARIHLQRNEPRLGDCEFLAAEPRARARQLAGAVARLGLEGARCNYVLGAADYNLLLVEAPKVQADEMPAAIRWRIKDLIDRPLDEVAVDVFPVPAEAYRSQGDMLYAVVARKSRILEARDAVEEAGLVLDAIDIPEMVMRNVSSLYTDDDNGLAFVDFRGSGTTLNLSKRGALYLTRHLSTLVGQHSAHGAEWEALRERLVLEIQRSLDYYESQMGQSTISRLLVAPRADAEELAGQLNEAMGVRVDAMDLSRCFQPGPDLPLTLQQACLTAIGAALRGLPESARAAA